VRHHAALCLTNLSVGPETHAVLIASGAHSSMARAMLAYPQQARLQVGLFVYVVVAMLCGELWRSCAWWLCVVIVHGDHNGVVRGCCAWLLCVMVVRCSCTSRLLR